MPSIFETYSIVIVSGTTAILIIAIASTVSINFGKNNGIIFGNTKMPRIEITHEIITVIFFNDLLAIPLASCGKRYLKTIDENITRIVNICNAKE